MNSREKGKRGEREWAKELNSLLGTDACRRGVQYSGSPDSPDVVGIPGLHAEVKLCEKLSLYEAMAQAEKESGDNIPYVAHRRSRKPWLVVVPADHLLPFCIDVISAAGGQVAW